MAKIRIREGTLEAADVTRRDGYPCRECPKDGLVSCQWRKCRAFSAFFRPEWRQITKNLKSRG